MRASSKKPLSMDLLTILAIGIVSFVIKDVLHAALGHEGACVIVMADLLALLHIFVLG